MSNTKTLNYPGILRAFNKVEETPEIADRTEILSALSKLIDRSIQKDLEQVEHQYKTFSHTVTVTEDEIQKLLTALNESEIVLYESMSNEQALIVNKHYRIAGAKVSNMRSKCRINPAKAKK